MTTALLVVTHLVCVGAGVILIPGFKKLADIIKKS